LEKIIKSKERHSCGIRQSPNNRVLVLRACPKTDKNRSRSSYKSCLKGYRRGTPEEQSQTIEFLFCGYAKDLIKTNPAAPTKAAFGINS